MEIEVVPTDREESHKEYVSLRDYFDSRLESIQRATEVAISASQRALEKADSANNARFAQVNEFRGAMEDQTSIMMPRAEYTVQHQALTDRVAAIELSLRHREGRTAGLGNVGSMILGVFVIVTALSGLGALLVTLLRR